MASVAKMIPSLKLNDGVSMPILGYGTGTAWFKRDPGASINRELVESIKLAIKMGYHHLDGAEVYNTEAELGAAIQESGVKRDQLFVTTKVIVNIADIPRAIETSLQKLQMDYVDLYLIHSPFFAESDADIQNAWSAMEKVKAAGKARSIGVSNFLQKHLEAISQTSKTTPSVNQIEYHPYLQHQGLVPFHESQGIRTSSYGPLTPATRAKGGPLDERLSALADKYSVTPEAVLLRWSLDRGTVPITTSSKETRLSSYLQVLGFKLTPTEVDEISQLGDEKHFRAFWQGKFAADDRS